MINPKILILPDIHGRKFYCKALCEAVDKGAGIVCLGDYLDPYPGDLWLRKNRHGYGGEFRLITATLGNRMNELITLLGEEHEKDGRC